MSNESKNKSQAYCITKVYLAYHNNHLPVGRKSFCESIIIDNNIFLKEAKSHAHTHRSIPFQGPGDFQWHQDHRGFLGGFSDPSKKKKIRILTVLQNIPIKIDITALKIETCLL